MNNAIGQEETYEKLSHSQYHAQYDLTNPEVFQDQGNKLSILEECMVLQAVMLKITDSKDPQEMWSKLRTYNEEGSYFKDWLKQNALTGNYTNGSPPNHEENNS